MKWFLIMALIILSAVPSSAVLMSNSSNPIVQRQVIVSSTGGGNITNNYNNTYINGTSYNATYDTWLPNWTAFHIYWYNGSDGVDNSSWNETRGDSLFYNRTWGVPLSNITGADPNHCSTGTYMSQLDFSNGNFTEVCLPFTAFNNSHTLDILNITGNDVNTCGGQFVNQVTYLNGDISVGCGAISGMDYTNLFRLNETNIVTQITNFTAIVNFFRDIFMNNNTIFYGNGTADYADELWNSTADEGQQQIHTNIIKDSVLMHDHAYGNMFVANANLAVPVALTYYKIPFQTSTLRDNVYFNTTIPRQRTLFTNVSGRYKVDWSVSFSDEGTITPPYNDYVFTIFVDGVAQLDGNAEIGTWLTTFRQNVGATAIVNCTNTSSIDLRVQQLIGPNTNLLVYDANLNIVRVGENP
jgi:hypothetical protein